MGFFLPEIEPGILRAFTLTILETLDPFRIQGPPLFNPFQLTFGVHVSIGGFKMIHQQKENMDRALSEGRPPSWKGGRQKVRKHPSPSFPKGLNDSRESHRLNHSGFTPETKA